MQSTYSLNAFAKDAQSGIVVFLVTLPFCTGIAVASGAPPLSGIIAGIIGGIVVGLLSNSQTSISGPAAALTAVVAMLITQLGSYEAFLVAVVLTGLIQIVFGALKVGNLSAFIPSSVIKGLLAAVGVILILKQIPHLLGHDANPEGDMSFIQPDKENTFSELLALFSGDVHRGAIAVGLISLAILIAWDRIKFLKRLPAPAPLIVVLLSVGLSLLLKQMGEPWAITPAHLITLPVANSFQEYLGFLRLPDFSMLLTPAVYMAAITLSIVTTLETMFNIEAIDRVDPKKRFTSPNRELYAGIGNVVNGFLGGLPITSVIVQGSVNTEAGCQTKMSAIFHGILLLVCVSLMPAILNLIPLAALAAILLFTGFKLVSPVVVRNVIKEGPYQYIPFFATMVAIIFTNLVVGALIGLVVSLMFILQSNYRRSQKRVVEKHVGGEVNVIELANQVSFLNRGALESAFRGMPEGSHLVIDANRTDYIDPDILTLIREFKEEVGPLNGVKVSCRGFKPIYNLPDEIQDMHVLTKEKQQAITPSEALNLLKEGNERFCSGRLLTRDPVAHISITSKGQHPFAVVLSCIDSRAPVETIFDLGLGDVFSIRMAGNVTSEKVLGSMEYGTAVAGAKLILVLGHTRCGAVAATVDLYDVEENVAQVTGCQHLESIINDIQTSVTTVRARVNNTPMEKQRDLIVEEVAKENIAQSVDNILNMSGTISRLVAENRVGIIGGKYDVATGSVEFYEELAQGFSIASLAEAR